MIVVVGLGAQVGDLTLRGLDAVMDAKVVLAKTRHTAGYVSIADFCTADCDDLYESCENFDSLNEAIVKRLTALKGKVVYAVPDNAVTDASVALLRQSCHDVQVIPSVGSASSALAFHPSTSFTCVSAYDVENLHALDTDLATVVYDLDDRALAGDVKLKLGEFYGDETAVFLADKEITLDELDRLEISAPAAFVIPPEQLLKKGKYTFADLTKILEILTGENGCPWDRAQTHATIRSNLVEEAFEAVDAIDSGDVDSMVEEFGDVLLQAVLHASIGKKEEEFDTSEMVDRLCQKLVFRHPHVFGQTHAKDADGALKSWEAAKAVEKSQETLYDKLIAIPAVFPQAMRAVKFGKRAVKAGIGADLTAEDYAELAVERLNALVDGEAEDSEFAFGEALYALYNFARIKSTDPEIATKRVIDSYLERFRLIEEELTKQKIKMADATREQIDQAVVKVVLRENCKS